MWTILIMNHLVNDDESHYQIISSTRIDHLFSAPALPFSVRRSAGALITSSSLVIARRQSSFSSFVQYPLFFTNTTSNPEHS